MRCVKKKHTHQRRVRLRVLKDRIAIVVEAKRDGFGSSRKEVLKCPLPRFTVVLHLGDRGKVHANREICQAGVLGNDLLGNRKKKLL